MKVNLYDQKGKKLTTSVELNDEIFGSRVSKSLLAQYLFVYSSNQRESNAHAKTRAEVSGGGRKPWAQKGTGRARHGSNRSPIWTKGGVTFGPRNERNFKKQLNRKAVKSAFRSVLSKLVKEDGLVVVDKLEVSTTKPAKQAADIAKALADTKVTFVTGKVLPEVLAAFSNLPKASVRFIGDISVYDFLIGGKVVITQDCLEFINKNWSK